MGANVEGPDSEFSTETLGDLYNKEKLLKWEAEIAPNIQADYISNKQVWSRTYLLT